MSRTVSLLALGLVMLMVSACAQQSVVSLLPGETRLSEIGLYRVAYQSYGGEVVEMPPSWLGHFEAISGISYMPGEQILNRPAILLHCPWRVPSGKVWVDYPLRFPNVKPVILALGVAMRPDAVLPDRSDGVTFSVYLLDAGQEHELLKEHWTKAEWQDFRFELSECAGREVTLRLQTEPGPNNNASFDFSYFGDPKITIGNERGKRSDLRQRLTSMKAYRAYQKADLSALNNDPSHRVIPSNLLPYQNRIEQIGNAYRLIYQGDDCRVVYTYTPQTGTLDDFQVQVDEGASFLPAVGGGVTVAVSSGQETKLLFARQGTADKIELADQGKSLTAVWNYAVEKTEFQVQWQFGIQGKALTIEASCKQPVLAAFSLGNVGLVPLRRTYAVPYLPGTVLYLPSENLFVNRYLDWTQSHASACPQGEATYDTKTDGTRNPLHESGYVAVSPNVYEVLPNIPNPPSPYLELLGPRIMLDIWGHHEGTYRGDAENLRVLKDNGVDHLAIIQHGWQRYGYDVKLPDHLPANPAFGGEEGMIEFGKAARECGYVWSLHENYIDLYPDAPSYDESAVVLRADGTKSPAWYNAGTGVQSWGLKCNRALDYARQNSPEAHRRYGTTAAYLDVHTCVPPWHQLDHDATQPMAAMQLAKVKYDSELFRFERDTHEGPLFGEGANHFYWAGKVDGVEAQVQGGETHEPFIDFDLLKIHPQMVNHGMGYYERWFEQGYGVQYGVNAGTVADIDKYRAQEIAYGHAGFVGHIATDNLRWVVKEHHMMHPVQALYGAAKVTDIKYEVDGQFVSGSVALVLGERLRQRIAYDSGLTVWINWGAEPWTVKGRILPQWGVLALGPQTEVATILQNGVLADYAECPEYLFVDARTSFELPYVQNVKDIEPRLADFAYLGEGKIRVTYEWVVNDTLDQDYHCFVHFTNPAAKEGEKIAFQQDHELPKPTSQWQVGETITDGPYEIIVPPDGFDTYDLVIGLYKGARVPLKGIISNGRVLIGRLMIQREGEHITNITLGDLSVDAARYEATREDFTKNLNPPGTWVDFGKIATNGSVKVNRSKDSLTLFPYPRDTEFRIALDLAKIVPGAQAKSAKVRALAAFTQEDMGDVEARTEHGRLVFDAGRVGAGRYVVTW
ncbi:MAG: DUF5696 domain-containing protein [Candidatus Zipacnadales bacterium]